MNRYLNTATKASKAAGRILLKNFKKIEHITDKGDDSFVTNVDLACEKKIISMIKKQFPTHNILSEEAGHKKKKSDYTWIIDPLDGTHEYMHGFDYFGVSIALTKKEKVILGVVYFPCSNKLYHAINGKGAYCNNKKIHVSKRKLKKSYIILSGNFKKFKKIKLKLFDNIVDKVFRVRIYGSAVYDLCNIAEGHADALIEYHTNPWDIAAGFLIVEEAGGKVTTFEGKPWFLDIKKYIVSNKVIHKDLMKIIKG